MPVDAAGAADASWEAQQQRLSNTQPFTPFGASLGGEHVFLVIIIVVAALILIGGRHFFRGMVSA